MSGACPPGAIVDKDGNATLAFRLLLQGLSEATGGAGRDIRTYAVSDTVVRVRLKGTDGVWRESADIPLT